MTRDRDQCAPGAQTRPDVKVFGRSSIVGALRVRRRSGIPWQRPVLVSLTSERFQMNLRTVWRCNPPPENTLKSPVSENHITQRAFCSPAVLALLPWVTQDITPPGPIFGARFLRTKEYPHTNQATLFRKAASKIFPTTPCSGPPLVLMWSSRALKLGPGGVSPKTVEPLSFAVLMLCRCVAVILVRRTHGLQDQPNKQRFLATSSGKARETR